jgi:NMD protein affecting ribosome stability and mRNA decay
MEDATKSGYYEGILQLRNCTKEAVQFARDRINAAEGVQITKEAKVPGGIDFFITSNKFLKKLGRMLKSKFTGIIKQSAKLHTADRQTGKGVYRGTILFRMPNFSIGDVGMFKGDEVKVISIASKVMLQDTKSGKKMRENFDEVNKSFRLS